MPSDDFLDPERNIRAAIGRAQQALDAYQRGPTDVLGDVIEQLEKAHFRLERAEREIIADALDAGVTWRDVGAVLGTNAGQARARFRER
jgi:hypothetical protein